MADYRFQVLLHNDSALPADDFVNVLYFQVDAPDTIEGRCDDIAQAYQLIDANLSGVLSGDMTIKVYDLAGGQPLVTRGYSAHLSPAATTGPSEVAVCLSYAAVDDPDSSTPRRRGRLFIGPIAGPTTPRPSATLQTAVLDFGEALSQIGFGGNTTWCLYSRTDNVLAKIESIWVDDAWDTQRRRGNAPTTRTVRDVQ